MVYYLGMLLPLLLVFIAGGLVGAVVYYQLSQRKSNNVSTSPDSTQANQLRQAADQTVSARIDKRKQRILAQAREAGRITNDGAEDLFCISDRTASRYLQQLTEVGELKRHGIERETYYTTTT